MPGATATGYIKQLSVSISINRLIKNIDERRHLVPLFPYRDNKRERDFKIYSRSDYQIGDTCYQLGCLRMFEEAQVPVRERERETDRQTDRQTERVIGGLPFHMSDVIRQQSRRRSINPVCCPVTDSTSQLSHAIRSCTG